MLTIVFFTFAAGVLYISLSKSEVVGSMSIESISNLCSQDPTTNAETMIPEFLHIYQSIRWLLTKFIVSEIVVGSGGQDIFLKYPSQYFNTKFEFVVSELVAGSSE